MGNPSEIIIENALDVIYQDDESKKVDESVDMANLSRDTNFEDDGYDKPIKPKKKSSNKKKMIFIVVAIVLACGIIGGIVASTINPPILDIENATVSEFERFFDICNYKELTYWTPNLVFEDALEEVQQAFGYKAGAVAFGDNILIDYSAYYVDAEGKYDVNSPFMSEAKREITVGNCDLFPGVSEFEQKLVNLPVGTQTTIDFTFPKDDNDPLLSEKVIKFIVKVTEGVRAYTDENVKLYTDFETIEEHREYLYDKYAKISVEEDKQALLDSKAQTTNLEKDDVVQKGDTIEISNLVVKCDGEKIDFLNIKTITLGSTDGILSINGYDGFDTKIIGSLVGSSIEYKYEVLQSDKIKDLSLIGKTLNVSLTIASACTITYPEYNDDLVRDVLGYNTVKEFEESSYEYAYGEYQKEIAENEKANAKETIWIEFVKSSTVKGYPKGLLKNYKSANIAMAKEEVEEYRSMGYDVSFEDLYTMETLELYAKSQIQQQMYAYYILKLENVELTQADYDEYARNYNLSTPYPDASAMIQEYENMYAKYFYKGYGEFFVRSSAAAEKAIDILYNYATRV